MKASSENAREQAVRRMLKAAYFQKEAEAEVEPNMRWQQDVMRAVRRIGPLKLRANPLRIFDRVLWRFATAACAFVILLSVYAGFNGWNPLDDLNAQFFSNPVEFTVAQAFGVYESYE